MPRHSVPIGYTTLFVLTLATLQYPESLKPCFTWRWHLLLVRSCSNLVQLQFRFSNSLRILVYSWNTGSLWMILIEFSKVFQSMTPTFNTKTSLKSFSIGKLPLNMYMNPIYNVICWAWKPDRRQLTCTLLNNYCNSFVPRKEEMIVSTKKTFHKT